MFQAGNAAPHKQRYRIHAGEQVRDEIRIRQQRSSIPNTAKPGSKSVTRSMSRSLRRTFPSPVRDGTRGSRLYRVQNKTPQTG